MARGGQWWNRMSVAQKRAYRLPPPVLFQCRLCPAKVTAVDRQGHVDRNHPKGNILVVFTVVR